MAAQNGVHATQTVAVCQLAGVRFVVWASQIVQALPRPDEVAPAPRRDTPVLGLFGHRGRTLPLIHLPRWLPWGRSINETAEQVLVLSQGSNWTAIGIDRLEALHRIRDGQCQQLHHGNNPEELFDEAVQIDDGTPSGTTLPLLDVARLMALSHTWSAHATGTDPGAEAGSRMEKAETQRWALLGCGVQLLAVEVDRLQAIEAMPVLQMPMGGHSPLRGFARWRGRDVAVLNPLRELGLACAGTNAAPLLAVLAHEHLCIGLAVDSGQAVRPLVLDGLRSAQEAGLPAHPGLRGVLDTADSPGLLMLDARSLLQAHALSTLGQDTAATQTGTADTTSASSEAWVVVRVGSLLALPMSRLEAIVPMDAPAAEPDPQDPSGGGARQVLWRGQTLGLSCLDAQGRPTRELPLHTAASGHTPCALIMRRDGKLGAVLVHGLHALVPAHQGRVSVLRQQAGQQLRALTVGRGAGSKSYRIWELDSTH